jgi:hypothetical protein
MSGASPYPPAVASPGGRELPEPPLVCDRSEDLAGMTSWAAFNEPRTHRYLLGRSWQPALPVMTWIMLNPSTADAEKNDPTIVRCMRFARREGCGGIHVVNLFALRATDPRDLRRHGDPVGPGNDRIIDGQACGLVVAAWGAGGMLGGRGPRVAARILSAGTTLLCVGVTKDGHPKHPLARGRERVPDDAPLTPWSAP